MPVKNYTCVTAVPCLNLSKNVNQAQMTRLVLADVWECETGEIIVSERYVQSIFLMYIFCSHRRLMCL